MKTIAFFNHKSGVGKTTLVYHLAHMFSRMGYPTLAVDLDPQADLTELFEEELQIKVLDNKENIYAWLSALIKNKPISPIYPANNNLSLIFGSLDLSLFEDMFSKSWFHLLHGYVSEIKTTIAFCQVLKLAQKKASPAIVLLDLGSNLGAINRAALLAADFFLVPLIPGRSVLSLHSLGVEVSRWRGEWKKILNQGNAHFLPMRRVASSLGYVLRLDSSRYNLDGWSKIISNKYSPHFSSKHHNIRKIPDRG